MTFQKPVKAAVVLALCTALAACGGNRGRSVAIPGDAPPGGIDNSPASNAGTYQKSSFWDIFGPSTADQTVQVNKYIWNATLDILNFLPIRSVDPFSGVIVTGYGNPPGGGRSYRATVHIIDPALDARSLKVALQSRGGPVSPATARAVEDAILSRARQMRIADRKL